MESGYSQSSVLDCSRKDGGNNEFRTQNRLGG
jgi:hypothetical protein